MKRITLIFILLPTFLTFSIGQTNERIKNTDYQLVLPAQDSTISFIINHGKIGVYDNVHDNELLLKGQIDGVEIAPINVYKAYIDLLAEDGRGELIVKETYLLSKDRSGKASISKVDSGKREKSYSHTGYFYENNIRLIDDGRVIHNLSAVEPSDMHNGLRIFQKSGVYSLKENRFVIPPEHVRIEAIRSLKYEKDGPLFFKSFVIEEDEAIHQVEYFDEEGDLYGLPTENFKYGLYNSEFQVLIEASDSKINSMRFGGFHKEDGINELYNKSGRLITTENIDISNYEEVFITEQYIVVRHSVYDEAVNFDDQEVYSFYDKTGEFIEGKSLEISKFLEMPNKALGIVTSYDEDFEYITYSGVFDFDKRAFAIPDIYDEIKVEGEHGTDYYFFCRKKDSITYYDMDFKVFNPSSK